MPTTIYPIKVTIPEAVRLADLYGIANDLATAYTRCQRAMQIAGSNPPDPQLVEVLAESALIRYFRCFKHSNARGSLLKSDLEPAWTDHHRFFEALRDKFVAHSDNPFEGTCVTAMACKVNGVRQPIHSLGMNDDRVCLADDHARALAELISHVRTVVKGLIEKEKPRVLEHIQGLSLDDLYSGGMPQPREITGADAFQNRKQK